MMSLPTKEELVNEVKVKIEEQYSAYLAKLQKRAQEIKEEAKKTVDKSLSGVSFGAP